MELTSARRYGIIIGLRLNILAAKLFCFSSHYPNSINSPLHRSTHGTQTPKGFAPGMLASATANLKPWVFPFSPRQQSAPGTHRQDHARSLTTQKGLASKWLVSQFTPAARAASNIHTSSSVGCSPARSGCAGAFCFAPSITERN